MKTQKFTFGKIKSDYYDKLVSVDAQAELKLKDVARNWETLETVTNVPEFSASAGVWNINKSDYNMCGQIFDEIAPQLMKNAEFRELYSLWKKYHLNDLKAGTKSQTEAIEAWEAQGNKYEYTAACEYLKSIDLYEDRGYKYGHGWLYMPIPDEDLKRIEKLLNLTIAHA